ncbi:MULTISPECIES: deazaflavin-dependent nitroreductase [Kribbella]|uniref:Nitroreductase family deazaflavin-dependent oxidoreductase n=1 Tax=Kribbella karoonensis TaxID=324851 RepID=A0ABP4PXM2_9ACTN
MAVQGLPGWLKPVNRLVKVLHKLGMRPGTIHLLSVPGRSTGRLRTTPVSPLTVDGRRYVLSPAPESDWVRNASAAGWGVLIQGRNRQKVRLEPLEDVRDREKVLRAFPAEVPHGVPFFLRIGAVTGATPDEFAAAAPRSVVFEVVAI